MLTVYDYDHWLLLTVRVQLSWIDIHRIMLP